MRWSWVLLATSPCGSAGANEHLGPCSAAGFTAASPGAPSAARTFETTSALAALTASIVAVVATLDAASMPAASMPAANVAAASMTAAMTDAVGVDTVTPRPAAVDPVLTSPAVRRAHPASSLALGDRNLEGVAQRHARQGANDDPGA